MTEPRVLVVDDEEGPREAIRMILKPRYQVFTAGSGEEVLAVLPGLRPDLIFMDVKMPRMDGVQLLERVKALDSGVEVVMITAYASLDTVQRAMRFGAMDYLVKPFAPRELQEAAERALARRRQRTDGPGGALTPLIGKMRDLAQRRDPVPGGDLAALLRAMLHEAQRVAGAAAASFLGAEPAVTVHSELSPGAGDAVVTAWRTALHAVHEPACTRPGLAWPLPWPAELDGLGLETATVVPVVDEGLPRVSAHLALYHRRAPAPGGPDLAALRPVTDLMVTAVRTSSLLTAAARQAAEQSLRAVQGEILRQISTAVLVDPALDRTLAAITEHLQQGAGYERVQVLLDPEELAGAEAAGRAVFPLVAQGRHLGALVVETSRELDPSERELLRMFSESVALVVRNANLHRELSEAKTFLENLIQSATESIVAVDPAGRVVTWNPAAERMFGRAADEARGKLLGDAMSPAVMVQLEPVLTAPRASRTVVLRIQEADRSFQDLTATGSPIPWGGRDEMGLLLIVRDVTEQRRWEEQLARSEKLSALGQLAMGMAHDFTNLLQAILGHTQLIAHEPSPERLQRGLSTIEQAVRDGVETVGRIRRFARREVDRRLERVDLRDVVRQVIEIVRPRWSQSDLKGTPIMVRQQLGPVPGIQARGAELREALINLVLNAVDAMPQGGAITLETRHEGDWVVLSVSDTGTGIPPEVRRRIFEPFFTTKESGTGLGLSIVSGIISSYGGTIGVDSDCGVGTTFTIRLPAA
ncbi:MAG TPA: response regulator [Methylomirabilota bacterium]|jgi:PAS domain S-box-containing protein|nr:response regulator [Methylomirabilota bacterium]